MAEAGSYSAARTGNWLWAVLVGAVLLVMELIVFAALVPAAWSRQVNSPHNDGPQLLDAVASEP